MCPARRVAAAMRARANPVKFPDPVKLFTSSGSQRQLDIRLPTSHSRRRPQLTCKSSPDTSEIPYWPVITPQIIEGQRPPCGAISTRSTALRIVSLALKIRFRASLEAIVADC